MKGEGDGVRERRLEVMRQPDVGAFGVVTLVLVLAHPGGRDHGLRAASGFGTDAVDRRGDGRAARGDLGVHVVVPARPGPTVSVPPWRAASRDRGAALVTVAVLIGAVLLGRLDDDPSRSAEVTLVVGALVGLLAGVGVTRRCVRRFGGITGDMLGAVVEVATTVVLLVVAVALGLQSTAA